MKARLIGFIFVIVVLAALFVLTGGDSSLPGSSTVQSQPMQPSSSDNDFKNLKIQ